MLFTLYTSPVGGVISSFGIAHTQYADDTQLYVALKDGSLSTLTQCIKALHHWLDLNGLCLNPEKTEALVDDTSERQRIEDHIDTIDTGTVHIKTSNSVKSLGVVIDSTLSFNQYVNNICKSAHFHIRALRHGSCYQMTLQRQSPAPWLLGGSTTVMQYCTVPRLRTLTSYSVCRTR